MMPKETLSQKYLQKLFLQISTRIKNNAGKAVFPSKEGAIRYLTLQARNKYPRSYMYVFNMVENRLTWCNGLSVLGLPDKAELVYNELVSRYHENQRNIITFHALKIHQLFLDYKDEICPEIYYTTRRTIRDNNGKYWTAYNVGNAFERDGNGYWVSYFSRWILQYEYEGEGYRAEFFYEGSEPQKYRAIIDRLNKRLEDIKADTFELLGFTKQQQEIIKFYSIEQGRKILKNILEPIIANDVANHFGFSINNVYSHNRNILQKAREIFPINNFQNALDVAIYLRKQNVII